MKLIITLLTTVVFNSLALAQTSDIEIITFKQWSAYKGFSALLNKNVCAASTQIIDQATGTSAELSVIKTINSDGSFSSAFLFVTHSGLASPLYKGRLKTDKSKEVSLTLVQAETGERSLLSRRSDTPLLISALKNQNAVKVDFVSVQGPITVPFSLSGSNKVINEMEKQCP